MSKWWKIRRRYSINLRLWTTTIVFTYPTRINCLTICIRVTSGIHFKSACWAQWGVVITGLKNNYNEKRKSLHIILAPNFFFWGEGVKIKWKLTIIWIKSISIRSTNITCRHLTFFNRINFRIDNYEKIKKYENNFHFYLIHFFGKLQKLIWIQSFLSFFCLMISQSFFFVQEIYSPGWCLFYK